VADFDQWSMVHVNDVSIAKTDFVGSPVDMKPVWCILCFVVVGARGESAKAVADEGARVTLTRLIYSLIDCVRLRVLMGVRSLIERSWQVENEMVYTVGELHWVKRAEKAVTQIRPGPVLDIG